jgi:hypothetical protein
MFSKTSPTQLTTRGIAPGRFEIREWMTQISIIWRESFCYGTMVQAETAPGEQEDLSLHNQASGSHTSYQPHWEQLFRGIKNNQQYECRDVLLRITATD